MKKEYDFSKARKNPYVLQKQIKINDCNKDKRFAEPLATVENSRQTFISNNQIDETNNNSK